MNSEPQTQSAYDLVLADLQAQRDKVDEAIKLISALRSGAVPFGTAATATSEPTIVESAGMFLGMSIVDASKKLLAMRKRTMGNPEIAKELQAGGLVLTGKDPVNVIGSVLTRRFNESGDVVKVGRGIWGLKEWYPGRNFKPAVKAVPIELDAEALAEIDKNLSGPSAPNLTEQDGLSPEAIAEFGRKFASSNPPLADDNGAVDMD